MNLGQQSFAVKERTEADIIHALIYAVSRDEAAIMLVDSNLHRDHILPSEKAFAYKLKLDALNHQGKTFGQVGQKYSRDLMAESVDESSRQTKVDRKSVV